MLTDTFRAGVQFMRVLLFQPEAFAGAEAVRVREEDLCTGVGAFAVSVLTSGATEGERTGNGMAGEAVGCNETLTGSSASCASASLFFSTAASLTAVALC